YLTQPIHDAHYKQMCQSVCYFMRQVSIAEAPTLDDDSFEPIFDGEDSAETFAEIDENRELDLQSLIAM
ncbi:1402_t:CDS:1, partial [Rhizophagus irregularis]